MSNLNLYKQRYIKDDQQGARKINSNELVAAKLEALLAPPKPEGFVEGLNPEQVEVLPEPEISLEEIRAEADQILEEARQKADALIVRANEQTEQIKENARSAGEQEGYEAGSQKAQEELAKEQEELAARREAMNQEYETRRQDMEGQVVGVVCDVVERVFGVSFTDKKPILLHLVKQAIQNIESTKEFQIRVHPSQYGYLKEHLEELEEQVGQAVTIDLETDNSLSETGCVIETDSGFFECGIDVQLENLLKTIRMLSV